MKIAPDPKAEVVRHPATEEYYLSFEAYYPDLDKVTSIKNSGRVRLLMPCMSTARALCDFLNDKADKPRPEPIPSHIEDYIISRTAELHRRVNEVIEDINKQKHLINEIASLHEKRQSDALAKIESMRRLPMGVEVKDAIDKLERRINSLEIHFDEHRRSHTVPDAARLEAVLKSIERDRLEKTESIERRILDLESKKGFFRK